MGLRWHLGRSFTARQLLPFPHAPAVKSRRAEARVVPERSGGSSATPYAEAHFPRRRSERVFARDLRLGHTCVGVIGTPSVAEGGISKRRASLKLRVAFIG